MDFQAKNITQPRTFDHEIALYNDQAAVQDQWTELNGELVVRNVLTPTLIAVHPPAGVPHRNEAVLIAPGGGMLVLAMDHEGVDVAHQLAAQGYTAYVLKYRVSKTPTGEADFGQACQRFYADKLSAGFGIADPHLETHEAVADLTAAVGLIRASSTVPDAKLHFIGFSAGAKVGIDALVSNGRGLNFASMGLIYFSLTQLNGLLDQPPKLFAVMADDDPLFSRSGFDLLNQWQAVGGSVEFHHFKSGGHGFGVRQQGKTSDQWFALYSQWLLSDD